MVSKVRAGASGVAAAAVALGVAELVSVLTGPRTAPLIAVGGAVVDAAPEPAKELAISLFGVYDKVALLIGTAVLLGAFAAGVGVAARKRAVYGWVGIGLFSLLGMVAALTRHNAAWTAALPSVVGGVAAAFVLAWLLRSASLVRPAEDQGNAGGALTPPDYPRSRRGLLVAFGLAAVTGVVGRLWAGARGVQVARSEVKLPEPVSKASAPPSEPSLSGLTSYVTRNEDFYTIDTALVAPQVDPATWQLRIHGRVDRTITIDFNELLARPMVERYITLACVSNPVGGDLIGNARWLGIPVKDLLAEAGPQAGADQVVMRSVDGWTCGSPTAALMDGRDALLAVGMNGEPLPVRHGFPVRMVVPGLYGYVSACKWITEMELTSFGDFDAYWIKKGWGEQGPIKTQSRIDVPRNDAKVAAGQVTVAGVAWAQHRGITVVEVRVDDGPWQSAELGGTASPDTWRQWMFPWQATAGRHTLSVRAADTTGTVQTDAEAAPFPDGATGWHQVSVTVSP